jgi:3-oxoacyl-(acyl-carrier-protein) synthase
MDARVEDAGGDPVVVTGLGHVVIGPGNAPCDPMPYLKVKKLRKYMGVQDDLAVVAAAKALESANLLPAPSASEGLGERTGLYLAVGYIPFEQADLDPLLAASLDAQGNFSMEAFSTTGFRTVNGLLTFRCLPNMPAYHVSINFDIQGPYFVTYPGPGQFYVALEEALIALEDGIIDMALVGGVAHQRNFLVESHFARVERPIRRHELADAAGYIILESRSHALARQAVNRTQLLRWETHYRACDPFAETPTSSWEMGITSCCMKSPGIYMGVASLPVMLSLAAEQRRRRLEDHMENRGGITAGSLWEFVS